MTFSLFEKSRQDGAPVELYEFKRGDTTWRYTSYASDYTYLSALFSKTHITRDAITRTIDINKGSIKIKLHRTNPLVETYLTGNPSEPTTLTVYRGHVGDPDQQFVVMWKGVVAGVSSEGAELALECNSNYAAVTNPGLRARFELTCRHTLYGNGCGLIKAAYARSATVVSVDQTNTIVTLDNLGGAVNGYFSGGLFTYNSIPHHIVAHTGLVVTLFNPVFGLTGKLVELNPGCDHTIATCRSKYQNQLNFGGFPWMPNTNPMGGSPVA